MFFNGFTKHMNIKLYYSKLTLTNIPKMPADESIFSLNDFS